MNIQCIKSNNKDFTVGVMYKATEDLFQTTSNGNLYYFIECVGDYVRVVGSYEDILFEIK